MVMKYLRSCQKGLEVGATRRLQSDQRLKLEQVLDSFVDGGANDEDVSGGSSIESMQSCTRCLV